MYEIITIDLQMECSGSGCATARSASGVDGWPCTSTLVQWVANTDDPSLPAR